MDADESIFPARSEPTIKCEARWRTGWDLLLSPSGDYIFFEKGKPHRAVKKGSVFMVDPDLPIWVQRKVNPHSNKDACLFGPIGKIPADIFHDTNRLA